MVELNLCHFLLVTRVLRELSHLRVPHEVLLRLVWELGDGHLEDLLELFWDIEVLVELVRGPALERALLRADAARVEPVDKVYHIIVEFLILLHPVVEGALQVIEVIAVRALEVDVELVAEIAGSYHLGVEASCLGCPIVEGEDVGVLVVDHHVLLLQER